jgi:NADH:ubiquinone oxidoreductase subunit K
MAALGWLALASLGWLARFARVIPSVATVRATIRVVSITTLATLGTSLAGFSTSLGSLAGFALARFSLAGFAVVVSVGVGIVITLYIQEVNRDRERKRCVE